MLKEWAYLPARATNQKEEDLAMKKTYHFLKLNEAEKVLPFTQRGLLEIKYETFLPCFCLSSFTF